jgi:DNA methylase
VRTHCLLSYSRRSPEFVRAAIETFTKPGDLVLDPHVGGGTSLVEALASGRAAVGVDINPLAEFVTRVKCIVFSEAELNTLDKWAARLPGVVNIHRPSVEFTDYAELGYYKHRNGRSMAPESSHPSMNSARRSVS